ncbi:HNH endonuclease signature motif containing protein [Longivirga aurantiaca]|uniref:DUF222 domain-containing protein n=1 Tax=Longivirga aurantiaca TaxID=1837743 RepID=A0ABW1SZG5_9ACTN
MRSTLAALPLEQKAARAVTALMEAAEAVAEAAREGGFAAAPAVVQPALAMAVLRSADQAKAAATVAVGAVHASGWLPDGQASLGRWLEVAAGLPGRDANGLIAGARSLAEDYSDLLDAWLTGDISGPMAATLRHGIDTCLVRVPSKERPAIRSSMVADLLPHAEHRTPDRMAKALKDLRANVDPDGANQAEIDAHDEQHIRFTPVGSGVQVKGYLSNETYAQIRTALEQTVDGWYREGALPDEDRIDPDDDTRAADRKRRQRQAHLHALALAQICTDALESGTLGTHHGLVPRITLTGSLDRLAVGLGGELLLPGHDTPAVVIPDTFRRFLCDAEITPIITANPSDTLGPIDLVLREANEPFLHVGRDYRVVPPRLRRALEHRDGHCAFPGCRVNVRRCRAHHVEHWEHGGPTDIDNCVLLCETHHRAVHEGGWTITAAGTDPRLPDYWAFTPPDRPRP